MKEEVSPHKSTSPPSQVLYSGMSDFACTCTCTLGTGGCPPWEEDPPRGLPPASPGTSHPPAPPASPDHPQAGPCRDRLTRYYHDSGHCRSFQYGGCAGNTNNFFSLAECGRQCGVPEGRGRRGEVEGRRGEALVKVRKVQEAVGDVKRRAKDGPGAGGGRLPRRRLDACRELPSPGTCAFAITR